MNKAVIAAAVSAFALTFAASASAALNPGRTDPIKTKDDIRYACTGVGIGSRSDPRWSNFSTKLVFDGHNGDYLGNVAVKIDNASGKDVFTASCQAPWVLINLPQGRYDIHATALNQAHDQFHQDLQVTVGKNGQVTRIIQFPSITS